MNEIKFFLIKIYQLAIDYIFPYFFLLKEYIYDYYIYIGIISFFLNILIIYLIRIIRWEKFFFFTNMIISLLNFLLTPILLFILLYNIYNKIFFKLFGYNYPKDINPNYNYIELYKEDKIDKLKKIYID